MFPENTTMFAEKKELEFLAVKLEKLGLFTALVDESGKRSYAQEYRSDQVPGTAVLVAVSWQWTLYAWSEARVYAEYENAETNHIVKQLLDDADLYTDICSYVLENGKFTADSIKEYVWELDGSLPGFENRENVNWQQVAEEINAQ